MLNVFIRPMTTVFVIVSWLVTNAAAGTVFDNLERPRDQFNSPLGNDRRFAQQFVMDDNSTVDEVTIELFRIGSVAGSMSIELWSDDGSDDPNAIVLGGELGTIPDVSEIPTSDTVFVFEKSVSGLVPSEKYWVIANFSGLTSELDASNTIGWPWSFTDAGTNGATNAHGSRDSGSTWVEFSSNTFPGFPFAPPVIHQMRVLTQATSLQPGDADQDLDFDQLDLVKVQVAAKYLTGESASWGEGDWNGAPGGSVGSPPAGDGVFNQLDIVAAQQAGVYLTGPYGALSGRFAQAGDGQTSIFYDPGTGELIVDAPAGQELTSINIDSAAGIFTSEPAQNLGGSFDNDSDTNIFKATFSGSFGSLSFGNVAQAGLSTDFLRGDLTVVGSLAGGGDLGDVDLITIPEPSALLLLLTGSGLVLYNRSRR